VLAVTEGRMIILDPAGLALVACKREGGP
jgi:hypothetical protein